jgi:hypothetical protein
VDVVVGILGPIAPPEACNGLMLPIVLFDEIYWFDAPSLIQSIPKPEKMTAKQFEPVAEELFSRIRQMADNAGATDDTITIAKKFPRVEVHDHSSFKTLGYSVKELIKAVETEWFSYLHADVYLPDGWFDTMRAHQAEFDWFGCPMRLTVLMEYLHVDPDRPYAGSQMGRKAAFIGGLDRIDDDYVYRQEDFVFARIVEDGQFRHGKVEDTFHYHQVMPLLYGDGPRVRRLKSIDFSVETTKAEELHTAETQLCGTIKYLRPDEFQIQAVEANVLALKRLGKFDFDKFIAWVGRTNPEWLPHVPHPGTLVRIRLKAIARRGLEYLLYKLG